MPEPRGNETIHESFTPTAKIDIPADPKEEKAWWAKKKPELMEALKTRVFSGWPKNPPPLDAKVAADVTHEGVRLRAIDFTSEAEIPLRMFVLTGPKAEKPRFIHFVVLDDAGWENWSSILAPEFRDALQLTTVPKKTEKRFDGDGLKSGVNAIALIVPRGIGPTQWTEPGSRDDIHIRRRFQLIGQTLDGQRVWDVRRAIAAGRTLADLREARPCLHGKGEAGVLALYAGLFEPSVQRFKLIDPPATHREGLAMLNVLKYLDIPQAVGMLESREVSLWIANGKDRKGWNWPLKLQETLGTKGLTVN
jgi:hypothetical protein